METPQLWLGSDLGDGHEGRCRGWELQLSGWSGDWSGVRVGCSGEGEGSLGYRMGLDACLHAGCLHPAVWMPAFGVHIPSCLEYRFPLHSSDIPDTVAHVAFCCS